jgi:hypothetical protein
MYIYIRVCVTAAIGLGRIMLLSLPCEACLSHGEYADILLCGFPDKRSPGMLPTEMLCDILDVTAKAPSCASHCAGLPPSLVVGTPVHLSLAIVYILCERSRIFHGCSCIGRTLLGQLQLGHCFS